MDSGPYDKQGFEGWFAELVEYQKQNGNVEVWERKETEPAARLVGKLCKENSHCSVDEQENKYKVYSTTMQDAC
jgi:hypothetical protein